MAWADVEGGWRLKADGALWHDHLEHVPKPRLIGLNDPARSLHGTRALGLILARPPGDSGHWGLAPASGPLWLISNLGPPSPAGGAPLSRSREAVEEAARLLPAGSVLLLEEQCAWMAGDRLLGMGPSQLDPGLRAALLRCLRRGITVVQAAGNSGLDLSRLRSLDGRPALRSLRGALVVAAARWRSGAWEAMPRSNRGRAVRFFAQGEALISTNAWSPADPRPLISPCFSDTSGAAAIIAGVAIAAQGMALRRWGRPLRPAALEELLLMGATPAAPGQQIGHMPDLQAVHRAIEAEAHPRLWPARALPSPPAERR